MLKVIDLDSQGKDADGFVFTLTIGEARFGVTDQEVAELIRSKYASVKGGSKRLAPKKTAAQESTSGDSLAPSLQEGDTRPSNEIAEGSH